MCGCSHVWLDIQVIDYGCFVDVICGVACIMSCNTGDFWLEDSVEKFRDSFW